MASSTPFLLPLPPLPPHFRSFSSDPAALVRDHRVKLDLAQRGITVRSFNADLLFEPWDVYDDSGAAFTTFHSFWDHCMNHPRPPKPDPPLPVPNGLLTPSSGTRVHDIASDILAVCSILRQASCPSRCQIRGLHSSCHLQCPFVRYSGMPTLHLL